MLNSRAFYTIIMHDFKFVVSYSELQGDNDTFFVQVEVIGISAEDAMMQFESHVAWKPEWSKYIHIIVVNSLPIITRE